MRDALMPCVRRSARALVAVLTSLGLIIGCSSLLSSVSPQSPSTSLTNSSKDFTDDFFEGPEKTLMLKFDSSHLMQGSLRRLPDEAWRYVMQKMGIAILSKVETSDMKAASQPVRAADSGCTAYLLSESSLFVYSDRVIFKTCGLSSPLRGLQLFLDIARGSAASPEAGLEQVMYSHPAFFRKHEQDAPHRSWEEERAFLQELFPTGVEQRLGTPEHGTDLFAAAFGAGSTSPWSVAEVYITELEQPAALATFSKDSKARIEAFWSEGSPDKTDDFYFDPSGYSANILRSNSYATMHASPQPSVSYLSHATNVLMSPDELKNMVAKTLQLAPGRHVGVFSFAFSPSLLHTSAVNSSLTIDGYAQGGSWTAEGLHFQTSLVSLISHRSSTCEADQTSQGQLACCSHF